MLRLSAWRHRHARQTAKRNCRHLHWESLEDRCVPVVTYHGGYMLTHVEAQSIFYGSLWSNPAYSGQVHTLDNFVKYAVQSTFMDGLTRAGYGVGRGIAHPGFTAPVKLANGTRLTDASIQAAIQGLINRGKVQAPNGSSLYIFWVQPNVVVTSPSGNSINDFVGYHDAFLGTNLAGHSLEINYAVLPYPGGTVGNGTTDGLSTIDELTSTAAHEIAESATDPGINSTAWYDDTLDGEVADITDDSYGRQDGWYFQLVAAKNDKPIPLSGFSKLPKTAVTLTSSASRIAAGEAETFTIKVAALSGTNRPTGKVELLSGSIIIATLDLRLVNGQKIATFTTKHLVKGTQPITAIYNGDASFREDFSSSINVTVT